MIANYFKQSFVYLAVLFTVSFGFTVVNPDKAYSQWTLEEMVDAAIDSYYSVSWVGKTTYLVVGLRAEDEKTFIRNSKYFQSSPNLELVYKGNKFGKSNLIFVFDYEHTAKSDKFLEKMHKGVAPKDLNRTKRILKDHRDERFIFNRRFVKEGGFGNACLVVLNKDTLTDEDAQDIWLGVFLTTTNKKLSPIYHGYKSKDGTFDAFDIDIVQCIIELSATEKIIPENKELVLDCVKQRKSRRQ